MILDLGQFFDQFEMVRVTAEYSNAVLVAMLPYISDVSQKLDLPLLRPVTAEHVVHCSIMPQRKLGVEIGIRGGWVFAFSRGYVDTIQGPKEFFAIQDLDKVPEFYGEVKMSKAEAIQLGRDTLKKLGIPLESVFAEQEPRVTEPIKVGTNTVPHYRIEWLDPRGVGQAPAGVDLDIDGNARRVARISLRNRSLERPPPKLAVEPIPIRNRPRWPSVNPEYARQLIPIVLRAIDDYGQKLSLSIPRPLTTNQVARFHVEDNLGRPHCEIELTNGWQFIYRDSMVNGYYAPDNLFNSDSHPILIKEFSGKWNLTETQAVALIRRTIARLGYPTNLVHMDFKPQVITPALPGIPRYSFWWWYENETHDDLQSKVEAEVDADKGELKSLYFEDKSFWNHAPPIDVPLSLPLTAETNSVSKKPAAHSRPLPRSSQEFFVPGK
ncbi:MAG: hypothetical protein EPO07_09310 [Verrucomicrobia bacterium]|nr:MAG: hypothetical protein EPO07_09310 [Verrucomicrobiota bacterium]